MVKPPTADTSTSAEVRARRAHSAISCMVSTVDAAYAAASLPSRWIVSPPDSMRCNHPFRPHIRAYPLLMALALPSMAVACPVVVPEGLLDHVFDVQYTDVPNVRLGSRSGAFVSFGRCTGRVDMDVSGLLAGLRYVRDINGEPAYEIVSAPGSPLMSFTMEAHGPNDDPDFEGVEYWHSLTPDRPKSFAWYDSSPQVQLRVEVVLYSPGGPLQPLPHATLGTFTTTVRQQPSNVVRQHLALGVNVRGPTCTLSDATVRLDDISANVLRADGDSGGRKTFTMDMNCPFAGTPVKLTMTDASNPANVTTALVPAAGSTTTGVAIRLLRGGTIIRLGTEWNHGSSTAGLNRISLAAEYLRISGALNTGVLTGEAVLTADYR
ncbi:fimbrial protein [Stenotrophomonas maltophilia]|uniref:fimbrial protein n=1 Tax=Stenotrophomonas maltophilia TaxID=40324 RepID=UPI0015DEE008|nr:fimbrial protein [Stenotrophomonas maltophilia]MBA0280451.1 fimbrial protein [Stenotrophomonas maltophilia]MBA0345826.1 fimbrial protein [Stenotrophomonas maltophilia]MBA0358965.1 fimbrial protein [Stenotrophomonas maltophilia]MBA0521094.1 fimbrial protein [Stenotrophomonas maltophilia]